MEEFLKAFEEYCSVPGVKSNKPGSYANGIRYLCECLKISEINEDSIKRIEEIKGYVSDRNSAFYHELLTFLEKRNQKSYLEKGFIQAALKCFWDYVNEIKENGENVIADWWPSQDEYSPGLTKEQWLALLHDKEVFTNNSLSVMAAMYAAGGQSSCVALSERFGNTSDMYRMTSVHLAERIVKKTGCRTLQQDGTTKWWPVLYVGRNAESAERGNFVWKLRSELYEALEEFGILRFVGKRGEEQLSIKEILQHINTYIAAKGFTFDEGLIENYYLSLKSKPFVILAGTSGTGKTRLVRLFAEAIGATVENGRYKLVSVRPDWSDSSDLFGHVDLNGKFIPGTIIDFINAAEWDSGNPYFLCLDEMNLARVEYYLSDILSVIETREYTEGRITTDPLITENYYGTDETAREHYGEIRIPENLYIVGTVNMDETTFPFSRKVLDRANTIEFSTVDFLNGFERATADNVLQPLDLGNDFIKAGYVFFKQCEREKEYVDKVCVELQEINRILEKANAHVGYRVRDEITFYMLNNKNADLLTGDEAFDNEIMQKILPRIQGSSSAVKSMLCELFMLCAGEYESYQTENDDVSSKMLKAVQKPECKYPKSAAKIAFMVRRFEEDGFTAYWL